MAADVPTRPSLLVRLRDAGDEAAWSQFVAIYTPLIFAFSRGRGLSEADAADVVQEVLKAVSAAISRFTYDPARSSFRNWLFTVVRSKLANHAAAQARQPRPAGETTLQQFTEQEPEAALEDAWRREYQANLLRWAAARIRGEFTEVTWNAFWRTAILAERVDVVAGELNLSVNAIYIARSRVTRRLKEVVESADETSGHFEGVAHV